PEIPAPARAQPPIAPARQLLFFVDPRDPLLSPASRRFSKRSRRSRSSRFSCPRLLFSDPPLGRLCSEESPSHQLIPISRARSTDAISSRSLIVRSSISSR